MTESVIILKSKFDMKHFLKDKSFLPTFFFFRITKHIFDSRCVISHALF